MRIFTDVAELAAAVGETLGPGPWHKVEQRQVDLFAEATGDHQWIHTDPERAAAGPFGGTIAHGYLTLSLLPALAKELYRVEGLRMAINYGLNKVRFPAPLRVGSSVRLTAQIMSVEPAADSVQMVARMTVETDGAIKPCCVAETVTRFYPG